MLDQVDVSYERADLALQVQQARTLLDQTDSQHKQIFVLTDMQQLSWEGLQDTGDEAGAEKKNERRTKSRLSSSTAIGTPRPTWQ